MSSHHVFPSDGRLFPDVAPTHEIPLEAPISQETLEDWQSLEDSYQLRMDGVDQQISQSQEPRTRAARALMKDLREARIGNLAKVEIVNEWVNKSIGYEKTKSSRAESEGRSHLDWHQTPFETLDTGRGECSDIARLKQYMLQQSGLSPQDMWIVAGAVKKKELEVGKPRPLLGYHEELAVQVDGRKYLLNDNRNMGSKKSGGVEPMNAQLRGETPNAWGPMEIYTVSQNGQISYLDKSQSWIETHDPAKIEGTHAPDRHKLSVSAAGATFEAAPAEAGRVAALARKHLKNALKFNPFRDTGGEQPGPRENPTSTNPVSKQTQDAMRAFQNAMDMDASGASLKRGLSAPKPDGF